MKKILLLGYGLIGKAIIKQCEIPTVEFTILDQVSSSNVYDHEYIQCEDAIQWIVHNNPVDFDYCINTLPVYDIRVKTIIDWCIETNTHYLDISEDRLVGKSIERWVAGTNILVTPHCGLAPGISTIIAQGLTTDFKQVHDIHIHVGALPLSASNNLKYHVTWSAAGVVNEYFSPSYNLYDGEVETGISFNGYKTLILGGKEYEAFHTSGGMGCYAEYWKDKGARNVTYRTIRYVGHFAYCRFLAKEDLEKELENTRLLYPFSDKVLIHISVTGETEKGIRTSLYTKEIRGEPDLLAIQKTTAAGPLSIVRLHMNGMLKDKFYHQYEFNKYSVLRCPEARCYN